MLRNVKTLNIYFFPFLPTLPSPQNAEYVILSPKPTPILSIHFFFYQWQLYSQFVLWLLSSINTLFLECTNGKYGKQCHNDCGYCRHMNECSHINGTCVKGCKPGYKQPMCTQSEWIVKNSKRSLSKTYFVIWYKCCLFYLIVHGIRSIFFQRFLTTNNLFRPSPPNLN